MPKPHEQCLALPNGQDLHPRRRRPLLGLAASAAITVAATGPALAQEVGTPIRLELNRLEAVQGETCRVYLLIENSSAEAYRSLRLDLFAFDTDGVIAKRVALEAGPLATRKTGVKLFDFQGLPCERISRVLLNDVIACEGSAGAKAECLALLRVESKVARVEFAK